MRRTKKTGNRYVELEERRFRAIRLYKKGLKQADIAREIRVSRQSISRWVAQYEQGGIKALRWNGRVGRNPKLTEDHIRRLRKILKEGPEKHGLHTDLWTLKNIAGIITEKFDVRLDESNVWRTLVRIGWSHRRKQLSSTRRKSPNGKKEMA